MFTYLCAVCNKPIADKKGAIHVSVTQAMNRRKQEANRIANEPSSMPFKDVMQYVNNQIFQAGWVPLHDTCVNAWEEKYPFGASYDIEASELRTPEQFISQTADLWAEPWFPYTAWDDFARHLLGP